MSERIEAFDALDTPTAPVTVVRARPAYFAVALLIAGIVAWGFWATYYSRPFSRTDLPSMLRRGGACTGFRRQRRAARRRVLQGAALFSAGLARRRPGVAAVICLISPA